MVSGINPIHILYNDGHIDTHLFLDTHLSPRRRHCDYLSGAIGEVENFAGFQLINGVEITKDLALH